MSDAKKFDQGKPRMELLPSSALLEISKVLTEGAKKYDPWNWAKGLQYSRLIGAVMRHVSAWKDGEDKDPETGLSHLAHAACGLMFLLDYLDRNQTHLDDRRPLETRRSVKTD